MSPSSLQFSQLSINPKMQASEYPLEDQSTRKGKGRASLDDNPTTPDRQAKQDSDDDEEDFDEETSSGDDDDVDAIVEAAPTKKLFALDHCRQIERTYAFKLSYAEVKDISVRINTNESAGLPIKCSCEVTTCPHVGWLLEQLAKTRTREMRDNVGPYEHITALGLQNICQRLGWEWVEQGVDAVENEYQLSKKEIPAIVVDTPSPQERVDVICDILATLSPNKSADDLKASVFGSSLESSVFNKVLAPRDLETTLARLLVRDGDLLRRFDTLVPSDTRATEFFLKMAERAQYTTVLLYDFETNGRQHNDIDHTVIWCGDQLVKIVDSIHQNVTVRQPLSPQSRGEAARALIQILDLVVNKNHEVYSNLPRRPRPHGEPLTARNLYLYLIGVDGRNNPAGGTFVLKALEDLPEAIDHVEKLTEILSKLEDVAWKAPQPYLFKLRGIVSRLTGEIIPSTSTMKAKKASSSTRTRKRLDRGDEEGQNSKRLK